MSMYAGIYLEILSWGRGEHGVGAVRRESIDLSEYYLSSTNISLGGKHGPLERGGGGAYPGFPPPPSQIDVSTCNVYVLYVHVCHIILCVM